jgi:hypothetical protein
MVDVSATEALFHQVYVFVMEPYIFSEKFTIVQATRHQLGNGSRECNEGVFRAFDCPFDICKDASQYHASRKGWHKRGSVRERISDPGISSIPELLAAEKGTASLAKLIQRMIAKSPVNK